VVASFFFLDNWLQDRIVDNAHAANMFFFLHLFLLVDGVSLHHTHIYILPICSPDIKENPFRCIHFHLLRQIQVVPNIRTQGYIMTEIGLLESYKTQEDWSMLGLSKT